MGNGFRLAPAADAERAREFVLAHGKARHRARVEGIFGRPEPDRAVVRELEGLQNPDGGFPLRQEAGAPSDAAETCRILAELKDMPPLRGSPMASRAVAYLRRCQRQDGSWECDLDVTAAATFALLSLDPDHRDPILRGSRWLRRELGGEGALRRAGSQALCLAAAVWWGTLGSGAGDADRAWAELAGRELTAAEIAGWLSLPLETGLPAGHVLQAVEMLHRLAALQQPDGSWPGDDPVETTIAALRVFRGFGIV